MYFLYTSVGVCVMRAAMNTVGEEEGRNLRAVTHCVEKEDAKKR